MFVAFLVPELIFLSIVTVIFLFNSLIKDVFMSVLPSCMYMGHIHVWYLLKAGREHQIPWNWKDGRLVVTIWMLVPNPL